MRGKRVLERIEERGCIERREGREVSKSHSKS